MDIKSNYTTAPSPTSATYDGRRDIYFMPRPAVRDLSHMMRQGELLAVACMV